MTLTSLEAWRTLFLRRGAAVARRRAGLGQWARWAVKFALLGIVAWLCFWWHAVILRVEKMPAKWAMTSYAVTVPASGEVTLGWRDLGQRPGDRSADEHHIRLRQEKDGGLRLYNVARTKLLALKFQGQGETAFETNAERFIIPAGGRTTVRVAGACLHFHDVTETHFDLDIRHGAKSCPDDVTASSVPPDVTYSYDAPGQLRLAPDTVRDPRCEQLTWVGGLLKRVRVNALGAVERSAALLHGRAHAFVTRIIRRDTESAIATLGGQYNCPETTTQVPQIGVPTLPWHSLKIVRSGSIFMIAPYEAAARGRHPVTFEARQGKDNWSAQGFQDIAWRIDEGGRFGALKEIVAGRTTYKVSLAGSAATGWKATFEPTGTVPLLAVDACNTEKDRKTCPHPLDDPEKSLGKDDLAANTLPGWKSRANLLAAGGASGGPWSKGTETTVWRWLLACTALIIAGLLSGSPLTLLRRSIPALGAATARPYRGVGSFLWTTLSVGLALAPDLVTSLNPHAALVLTLANWSLAGFILIVGVSGILLGLLWIAVTMLAASGAINLAMMAVDADSTRMLANYVRHQTMFLDLVPPLVIAVASCPPAALRPALQTFVADAQGWSRLIRFLPAAAIFVLFAAWYLLGRQTGFAVFQPVEAGKFAVVFLIATILMTIDPQFRGRTEGFALASLVVPLLLVALFLLFLIGVPLLRSDWSPALIMVLLFVFVSLWFGVLIAIRGLRDQIIAHHHRQAFPRVFKPALSFRWWLKRTWLLAAMLIVAVPLALWFALGSPLDSTAMHIAGVRSGNTDVIARLKALEREGLGASRRLVVERIISWLDLNYERTRLPSCTFPDTTTSQEPSMSEAPPRACYYDIEWQLIRSRYAIGDAPCGMAEPLRTAPGWNAIAHEAGSVVERGLAATALCDAPRLAKSEPIDIPVVESDFAASYLLGRLGLSAALLFYAAQALLKIVVAIGLVIVVWTPAGGRVDETVRRYVAIVVFGCVALLSLQWTLSWSNTLGLLPVMGQPMTWLSYATSHHLFVAVPCLLVFIMGLRFAGMPPYRYAPRTPPDAFVRRAGGMAPARRADAQPTSASRRSVPR